MPNAPTHDFLTLVTVTGADVAYFNLAPHPNPTLAALFTASYVFAGYACAGDLDLKSKEYRRWGPLRFLWLPYQKLVPHRSWVSHGLIFGGVFRLLYLAGVCTLLFWGGLWLYGRYVPRVHPDALTRAQWQSLFAFTHAHPQWTFALLSGFILAGTTHAIADTVFTWCKRKL
jgi:uncharacterized metal-binding protein